MRIAVAGSHSTGKSTLIAAFAALGPDYIVVPEAYEELAHEITLLPSEGPDIEGLALLLRHTISMVESHKRSGAVIFERSPVDYLAYAAASRSIARAERARFLQSSVPAVRDALQNLDLIALLPVSRNGPVTGRPGEDERFRRRVDEELRKALLDDDFELFEGGDAARVVVLPESAEGQLTELLKIPEGETR